MTAKEKAKELINKFKPHSHFWVHDLGKQKDYDIEQLENAKQCALIAIDEIMKYIETSYYNKDIIKGAKLYWKEVKKEIENI